MYKALVLDMDGTLINSEELVLRTLRETMEEYDRPITQEEALLSIGSVSSSLMETYGFGERSEEVAQRWVEIMSHVLDQVPLFPGVEEVLAAPIRRGVVTSQTRQELDANLNRLNIRHCFEVTVGADDTPYQKPDPQPLLHCLERMGVSPKDALFVGDTQFDRLCAQAAGVDFGLALWGVHSTQGLEDATVHLAHPSELLGLVERV